MKKHILCIGCLSFAVSAVFAANSSQPFSPFVTGDAEGDVIVSWSGLFDGKNALVQQVSHVPDQQPWTAASRVSTLGVDTLYSQVAFNGQDTLFVWLAHNGSNWQVYGAASTFEQDPSSVVALSLASTNSFSPRVGIDDAGNGVAVWQETLSDGEFAISAVAHSAMTGWPVENPVHIVKCSLAVSNPDLTVIGSSGDAVAVWEGNDMLQGSDTIQASFFSFEDGWTLPVAIPGTAGLEAKNPQVTSSPNGEIIATWHLTVGNRRGIQISSYANQTWSEPVTLSVPNFHLLNPQIAFNASGEGVALVAEMNNGTGTGSAILGAVRNEEGQWDSWLISGPDEQAVNPRIMFNDDRQAVAVWENSGIIRASLFSSNAWSETPVSLSTSGYNSSGPSLWMDNSEYAVAAWQAIAVGEQAVTADQETVYQAAILPSFASGWDAAQIISNQ